MASVGKSDAPSAPPPESDLAGLTSDDVAPLPPAYSVVAPGTPSEADRLLDLRGALSTWPAAALADMLVELARADSAVLACLESRVEARGAALQPAAEATRGERGPPPTAMGGLVAATYGAGAADAKALEAQSSRAGDGGASASAGAASGSPDGASASAPGAAPAAAPAPGKKSLMSMMRSTLSSVGATARVVTAQLGVAMGVKYDAQRFRTAFGLDYSEPLIAEEECTLLDGPYKLPGQVYLTPHLVCVYMVANNKEFHVTLALSDVVEVHHLACLNIKGRSAPEITVPEPGTRPNVLRLVMRQGMYHTIVVEPDRLPVPASVLALAWDATRADGRSTLVAPPSIRPYSVKFAQAIDVPLVGMHKCHIVSADESVATVLHLFLGAVCFEVGLTPVVIPVDTIQLIVPCVATPVRGSPVPVLTPAAVSTGPAPSAVQLYTSDGCIHQLIGFGSFEMAVNQLVWLWTLASGAVPAYV